MHNAKPAVVFFGTPHFAVPALRSLVKAGYSVHVVTRIDKPVGRKRVVTPPPIKVVAQELGLDILQPKKLDATFAEELRGWDPDVCVLSAYGKIIPENILGIPKRGFLNIHPSLLPRHRGASPIAATILAGDAETGVTIMQMDAGLDTGPVVARQVVPLNGSETTGSLTEKLAELGANLLTATLPGYLAEKEPIHPQDTAGVTMTHILSSEDGKISWKAKGAVIERMVRAYHPWPAAWTEVLGKRLKILSAKLHTDHSLDHPGTFAAVGRTLGIVCGDGTVLELVSVQLEGKQPMTGAAFANGYAKKLTASNIAEK